MSDKETGSDRPTSEETEQASEATADTSEASDTGAATKPEAPEDESAADGDRPSLVEEVEPESIDPAKSHHPPPPPRLRATDARPIQLQGDPKLARDLMTRQLYTIEPDAKLESLEQHMEKLRFRHLPVVAGEKLVGLINHSDLLHASSSHLTSHSKEVDELVHKLPAQRIMRTDFVTVRPDAPLTEVAAEMWRARAGCVLVTEEGGRLLGIITQADFVRLSHHLLSHASQDS